MSKTTYHYYVDQIKDASGWFDGESGVVLQWTTEPPTQNAPGWYWIRAEVAGYEVVGVTQFPYPNQTNIDKITHWLGPLPVPEVPGEGK